MAQVIANELVWGSSVVPEDVGEIFAVSSKLNNTLGFTLDWDYSSDGPILKDIRKGSSDFCRVVTDLMELRELGAEGSIFLSCPGSKFPLIKIVLTDLGIAYYMKPLSGLMSTLDCQITYAKLVHDIHKV